ncbi:MAG: trimethylamine methyltransferase family protein [Thermoleophilia bacterium]|nr:trimethylamine methyltransferase family protein [Thermoleophilia bacterium]
MRAQVEWTTEEERARIVDAALGLLERVGMQFGEGDALEAVAAAGAPVDRERGVARLPHELIEHALHGCPRDVVLGAATPADDCLLTEGVPHFTNSGSPPEALDMETGRRRRSTRDDLRRASMVLDAMPSTSIAWAICTATDIADERRTLAELETLLSWTSMHVQHEIEGRWQVEPFMRMTEAAGGDVRRRPRTSIVCCTASPLHAHGELLDASTDLAALGIPVVVLPMPIAGATAPITAAGAATMNVAEFLGAATAVQLRAPGAPLVMGIGPGLLDMRETTYCFGALEAGLAAAVCTEVAHHLGVPCLAPAMATDAKYPGIQAAYEKALKGLTVASALPDLMTGGIGVLQGAGLMSLPQIVIDDEIAQMILRILGGVEVSDETIMAEAMERVGHAGNFLVEKETRRRLRAGELFFPTIADRQSYEHWEAKGRGELEKATARVRELVDAAEARGPRLDEAARATLAACVEEAAAAAPKAG